MKLLIAAEIFEPDIGGPATYSKQLATELTKRGWEVNLVCYADKRQADNYPFKVFRIVRSTFKPLHYYRYFRKLKQLAKQSDVIYAMGPIGSGRPALKVAQQLKKKLVVKVVGDYAWEQARGMQVTDIGIEDFQQKTFFGKIGWLQMMERQVCQGAGQIVVPSQYLKKIVTGWGVNADKITVVYNSFVQTAISREENVTEDLIVSIGRLVVWKGHSLLIEVMSELAQMNSKFRLLILGNGPEKDYLELKVKGLNLYDKVKIKLVEEQQRDRYLAQAKMFVLNTGYEGLSHTILECFAAGVPVITTNVGGNPELITDGVSGLLVDYNNKEQLKTAINKLNNDPALRQQFVDNAKQVLPKFSFEKMITDTINALQQQ